jgi:type III secretory pathway component EscR
MTTEKNTSMFFGLVFTFQAAAMQQMGKLKNPVTDKIERDLQQAQLSIDVLDMIEEKTKGNLSDDEAKFLKGVLQELKLNYVDEMTKEKKPEEEKQVKS